MAISVGNISSAEAIGNVSFSHNNDGDLLVVSFCVNNVNALSHTITGVTYNGVAMTQALAYGAGATRGVAGIFYLKNPPTGSHTVACTFSSTNIYAAAFAHSLSGTHPTTPISNTDFVDDNTPSSATSSSISLTSSVFALDAICNPGASSATSGAGQVAVSKSVYGTGLFKASYKTTGGTMSHSWSKSGTNGFAQVGVNIAVDPTVAPTITTQAASDILVEQATLNGTVSATGGANLSTRGFYLVAGAGTPTSGDTVISESGSFGTGAYALDATSLSPGTLYSARAFGTNSAGTSVGAVVQFTTLAPPTVTTQAVSGFDYDSAFLNGTITDVGSANATTRGFYWKVGTTGDPTASDNILSESGDFGTGAYSIEVTGLTEETSYRIAAFATNPDGTSVGSTAGFTTTTKPTVAGGGGVGGLSFGIGRL